MLLLKYLWNLMLIVKYLWNLMLILKHLWNLMLIVKYLWNLMLVFVSEGATKQHHQPLWTWKPAWTIQTGNRIDKTKTMKFHFHISWEKSCPIIFNIKSCLPRSAPQQRTEPRSQCTRSLTSTATRSGRCPSATTSARWVATLSRSSWSTSFLCGYAGQDWWGDIKERD